MSISTKKVRIAMSEPEAIYNPQAKKKSVNLSINSDLVEKARAQNINLSQTLENSLPQQFQQ
ncbi:type II toxin-antitoxin system CcdA family antitoxin, partial [Kaarinaea lacus]